MNKIVLISTFCFFLLQNTYAQKHQISDKDTLLYYLDNWGNLTSSKASADHFLVIMPADSSSGIKVYPVIEYYPNWKPKLMGYSRSQQYNNLVFEGEQVKFYKNGNKKYVTNYSGGEVKGAVTVYYPNGKLYADEYLNNNGNSLLVNCRDSTGKILTDNGNGKWITYSDDFVTELEEGMVKDSLEEGMWYEKHNSITDSTLYKKGAAISSSDKKHPLGKVADMVFTAVQQEPACPAFYQLIVRQMRYPADAKEKNIQGKVYVQFVVEKNGSLTQPKILRSPIQSLSDEVLRMISLSPKWQPGLQNGIPVRCLYTVPISFTLASD